MKEEEEFTMPKEDLVTILFQGTFALKIWATLIGEVVRFPFEMT